MDLTQKQGNGRTLVELVFGPDELRDNQGRAVGRAVFTLDPAGLSGFAYGWRCEREPTIFEFYTIGEHPMIPIARDSFEPYLARVRELMPDLYDSLFPVTSYLYTN